VLQAKPKSPQPRSKTKAAPKTAATAKPRAAKKAAKKATTDDMTKAEVASNPACAHIQVEIHEVFQTPMPAT
jgi:hypothetical protein